jgi:hypothetical protein
MIGVRIRTLAAAVAVTGFVGVTPALAAAGHASHKLSVSLTGPLTNVSFNTSYTYTVQVVPHTSYGNADLVFVVPNSGNKPSSYKRIHLIARRPSKGTFTTRFFSPLSGNTDTIDVSILVPSAHSGLRALFHKTYVVTPAPNQPKTLPPPLIGEHI